MLMVSCPNSFHNSCEVFPDREIKSYYIAHAVQ